MIRRKPGGSDRNAEGKKLAFQGKDDVEIEDLTMFEGI